MTVVTRSGDGESPKRSRANTLVRLVEAGAEVFAAKSLGDVTVDDVVGAAGFSRGAFYSNFSSIEQLFYAVYARQADKMTDAVRAAVGTIAAADFTFASLGVVFDALRPFGRQWYLLHHEFALLAVRDPAARERFSEEADRLQDDIERIVAQVLELLDRRPAVSVQQLTDVLVALYLHSLGNEQLGSGDLDSEHLVADILPTLIMAMSAPDG